MSFEIDMSDFIKRMDMSKATYRGAGEDALRENSLDLEKEAKETCPVKEGTLQGDIMRNPGIIDLGGGIEAQVHAGTGNSRDYALRVHEEMEPAGGTQPGDVTKQRPAKPWGKAGGKYLERPLMHKGQAYTANIARHMKKVK